jgi:hypothetical protein
MSKSPAVFFHLLIVLSLSACKVTRVLPGDSIVIEWDWLRSTPLSLAGLVLLGVGMLMLRDTVVDHRSEFFLSRGWSRFFVGKYGAGMVCAGIIAFVFAWHDHGLYQKLRREGVEIKINGKVVPFAWKDIKESRGRIKSPLFSLCFERDGERGCMEFNQKEIGVQVQDLAIEITESSLKANGVSLQGPGFQFIDAMKTWKP